MQPIVFAESQCHVAVSLTAISTAASPNDISAAPAQFTRPGTRTGDSGHEEMRRDRGDDDRDQRQPEEIVEREVVDDRACEHDAGAAADAEQRRHQADPGGHPLARELVADDPEGEREDAARGALDDPPDEHQRRATTPARRRTVPTASSASTITSSRSLPYMSPSRPISGVATDALSRYEVSTQLTEFSDVCSACWMSGSAGATSDCRSAYDTPASASTQT